MHLWFNVSIYQRKHQNSEKPYEVRKGEWLSFNLIWPLLTFEGQGYMWKSGVLVITQCMLIYNIHTTNKNNVVRTEKVSNCSNVGQPFFCESVGKHACYYRTKLLGVASIPLHWPGLISAATSLPFLCSSALDGWVLGPPHTDAFFMRCVAIRHDASMHIRGRRTHRDGSQRDVWKTHPCGAYGLVGYTEKFG